jgi:hypothetical protein
MAFTPFPITVTAVDEIGNVVRDYSGVANLSDYSGTIVPSTTSGGFIFGVWTGNVTVTNSYIDNAILVTDGDISGVSNLLTINPDLSQESWAGSIFAFLPLNYWFGIVTMFSCFAVLVTLYFRSGVYGYVLDLNNRQPVKDSEVVLLDQKGNLIRQSVTGTDGKYKFSHLGRGNYTIMVNHPDNQKFEPTKDCVLPRLLRRVEKDLELEPGEEKSIIQIPDEVFIVLKEHSKSQKRTVQEIVEENPMLLTQLLQKRKDKEVNAKVLKALRKMAKSQKRTVQEIVEENPSLVTQLMKKKKTKKLKPKMHSCETNSNHES